MNNLQIINHNGTFAVDSREVAEMVEKPHNDLMKSIRQYCEYLNQGNLSLVDFFVESSYLDAKGETRPCYLLTKKGCDMVANKMTGEKGIIFTALYVTKFEEMEKALAPQPISSIPEFLLQTAHAMVDQERQIKSLAANQEKQQQAIEDQVQTIQNIKEALLPNDKEWRKSINEKLNQVAKACDADYYGVRSSSYKTLEQRGACNLSRRVQNLKNRLSESGATKTTIDKACKLDAIESDKRLKEIYSSIVREMVVKYVA